MKLYTVDTLKNQNYDELGIVEGFSKNRTFAINKAKDEMIAEAEQLEADAVIALRYETSSIMEGASEILAYGTAIKFK